MGNSGGPGGLDPEDDDDQQDSLTEGEGEAEPSPFVAKLGKKEKKLRKDATRALTSWERYRALTDALDEAIDLVDLADHKARFALVIMAAVNIVLFFSTDALSPLKSSSTGMQVVIAIYLFVYVCVALYFFLQAIEALRPRQSQPQVLSPAGQATLQDFPLGIRFYEDILRRDVEGFKKAWQDVRIGQLNAELAVQAHAMAEINRAKYSALRRLYKGLQIMTLMAVGLVALALAAQVVGTARRASQPLARGADVLGQASRIRVPGLAEPSGIAFHPGRGRLVAVSDDGTMAEVDTEGRASAASNIEKQIEDVVFHPGTGGLMMVSESRGELLLFDPAGQRVVRRVRIDVPAVLGTPAQDRNHGFEGLAFRPDPGRSGGGVVYLAHQRAPAIIVALAFDPATATAVGAESVVARWPAPYEDITAVAWVPELSRLLAIADSADRLLVFGDDGTLETEIPLPGLQQEGLAFDPQGTLWIADDKDKSLLRIPGALAALQQRLSASPAGEGGGLLNGRRPGILEP